jgi:hypothetical protein
MYTIFFIIELPQLQPKSVYASRNYYSIQHTVYHLAIRLLLLIKFQLPPIGMGKSRSLYHWMSTSWSFSQIGAGSYV